MRHVDSYLSLMSTTSSTKPTPPSNDVSSARLNDLGGSAAKDVRAHEHARHRTKERQEHALAKERKEKAATVRALGLKVVRGAKLVRRLSMETWDGLVPKEQQQPARRSVEEAVPLPQSPLSPQRDGLGSPFTELTLGDVISKPRQPKAKQLDFEVIPPIRAVIALDDVDVDADEPWEYITRASINDNVFAWKGKSYAQAVASAM